MYQRGNIQEESMSYGHKKHEHVTHVIRRHGAAPHLPGKR